MKILAFLALATAAAPAAAKADFTFKCKSVVFADQLSADLRFAENGRGGQMSLDYWNGYPPIGLVYGALKAPSTKNNLVIFPTVRDSHSGYLAELSVPANYLSAQDFKAKIALTTKAGKKENHELNCNRF
jgi:hypothetical protein